MKTKLKLNDLKVTSFVTELNNKGKQTIQGGSDDFDLCFGRYLLQSIEERYCEPIDKAEDFCRKIEKWTSYVFW